jgi:anti-sigma-K factor RskA
LTCAERRDAIFLHAAGELDPAESAELRAHLDSGCPRCLGALAEAQALLASLALALDPLEPPPGLRERVRARVAAEAVNARPRSTGLARLALAAGIAALVAFGVGVAVTRVRVAELERTLAELRLETERTRAVLGVVSAPDVRLLDLSGPALDFRGTARLYWDYDTGGCYLRGTKVRPPAAGKTYVLWFTDGDGEPLRGGAIEVSQGGEATLLTEMPREIDVSADVYVTAEPDPSVARPSAEPVLSGLLDEL